MSLSRFFQTGLFPFLVANAPPAVSQLLFRFAGSVYFLLNAPERRLIRRNVRDLLRFRRESRADRIVQKVFHGIFDHYFEKMLLASRTPAFISRFVERRAVFERETLLRESYGLGRGVILVTAHWGAVELIPAILQLRGYPISVILETSTVALRRRLQSLADGRDVELILASDGGRVLQRALDALARGRILITQCDEVDAWRRRRSRTIRLFGRDLYFDHTLDFLAAKSGASVLGMYCKRLATRRYRIVCEDIAAVGGSSDVARRSLALWERYLLEDPDQWYQWKKWRAMVAV